MEELYKRKIPPVLNTKENLTAKNKTDEPYETSLKSGPLFIEPCLYLRRLPFKNKVYSRNQNCIKLYTNSNSNYQNLKYTTMPFPF